MKKYTIEEIKAIREKNMGDKSFSECFRALGRDYINNSKENAEVYRSWGYNVDDNCNLIEDNSDHDTEMDWGYAEDLSYDER